VAENRQIGWCFHVFFEALGAKKHRKYWFFLRLGAWYLRCCFASGNKKSRYFQYFLASA
jgi:hypothetical protein